LQTFSLVAQFLTLFCGILIGYNQKLNSENIDTTDVGDKKNVSMMGVMIVIINSATLIWPLVRKILSGKVEEYWGHTKSILGLPFNFWMSCCGGNTRAAAARKKDEDARATRRKVAKEEKWRTEFENNRNNDEMAVFGHVSPAALVSGEDSEHRIGMPFRDDKTTNLIVPWDALAPLHCVGSRQQSPHGSTRVVDSNSYTGNADEGLQTSIVQTPIASLNTHCKFPRIYPSSAILESIQVDSRIAPRVPCQTQSISTPSSANTETHRLLSGLPVMQQIPVGLRSSLRYATTSPPVLLSHVDRGNEGDGVNLYPQPLVLSPPLYPAR